MVSNLNHTFIIIRSRVILSIYGICGYKKYVRYIIKYVIYYIDIYIYRTTIILLIRLNLSYTKVIYYLMILNIIFAVLLG